MEKNMQPSPNNSPFRRRFRNSHRECAVLLTLALMSVGCALQLAPIRTPYLVHSPNAAAQEKFAAIGLNLEDPLPGYAGAVGLGDDLVFSSAAGWADVVGQRCATPSTRFRIYSTSKSIGAVVAMMLVEAGKLNLDAPIATYLPSLPPRLRTIKVRHLLAHRSGIRHYRSGEWDRVSSVACARPQEALADFIHDPLQFEPGTGYQYTTFGYVLLTAVLEAAAGQPFEVLLREQVLKPAGMVATALEGHPAAGADQSMFYDRSEAGDFSPTHGIHSSCKFFGGGLVSTAEDLVRFGLALVNGRLISPASLAQMLTIHSADGNGSQPPYGFGFFSGDQVLTHLGVSLEDYVPAWWHGGNGRGGYSVLIIYPERRAAAAVTTNVRASGRLVGATHALALPFLRAASVPPVRPAGPVDPLLERNVP